MDKCPGLIGGVNDPSTSCNIQSPIQETILGVLEALPGNNPPTGWGQTSDISEPAGPNPASSPSSVASTQASPTAGSNPTPPSAATASNLIPSHGLNTSPSSLNAPTIPSSFAPSSSSTYNEIPPSSGFPVIAPTASSRLPYSPPANSATISSGTNSSPTPFESSGIVSVPGWTYSGCYSDSLNSRVLTGITFADLGIGNVTSTGCLMYCDDNGYSIAGTEYAGQCFCGNELVGSSAIDDTRCDMACEGAPDEICGGSLALSIYEQSSCSKISSTRKRFHPRDLRVRE